MPDMMEGKGHITLKVGSLLQSQEASAATSLSPNSVHCQTQDEALLSQTREHTTVFLKHLHCQSSLFPSLNPTALTGLSSGRTSQRNLLQDSCGPTEHCPIRGLHRSCDNYLEFEGLR